MALWEHVLLMIFDNSAVTKPSVGKVLWFCNTQQHQSSSAPSNVQTIDLWPSTQSSDFTNSHGSWKNDCAVCKLSFGHLELDRSHCCQPAVYAYPSVSVMNAQTTGGKRVRNTSCDRTFPYAALRSACCLLPTHLLVPTCLYTVVSGFQPRLQRTSLSLCLSFLLFLLRLLWREGNYLICLCDSDYAALGSTGYRFFFHCGHHWVGWEHQPQTSITAAQLQLDLPATRTFTLLPLQQQESRQAMPPGPTLPF